jgi:peptidoglycan/xylan/chitin deacetylase (PgdA/CDA1 family)
VRASCCLAALVALGGGGLLAYAFLPSLGGIPRRGRPGRQQVAITFDDGPNEPYTSQILDLLGRHDARATFFLLGRAVEQHPEVARRIGSLGHALGSHTYDHVKLHRLSAAAMDAEIVRGEAALAAAGVAGSGLFRAPHGFKNPLLPGVLRRRGLQLIAWTHGVWDTDRPGADVIATRALRGLRDGTILLLHDGQPGTDRSQTVAALALILAACQRQGLKCVTVPELLTAPRPPR